jgi:hypothetical protein
LRETAVSYARTPREFDHERVPPGGLPYFNTTIIIPYVIGLSRPFERNPLDRKEIICGSLFAFVARFGALIVGRWQDASGRHSELCHYEAWEGRNSD